MPTVIRHRFRKPVSGFISVMLLGLALMSSPGAGSAVVIERGMNVVLLGNGLGSRMMEFGYFEAEVQSRYPDYQLIIRNMCDEGNTPGFRPHSGRPSPWAFPGAEQFHPPLSAAKDRWGSGHSGQGDYETPDQWLSRLNADLIIAFFGYNESFNGVAGLENFTGELEAFIDHTLSQTYNGFTAPELVLVSPVAFEDLSARHGTPDGVRENANLALYTAAMEKVAGEKQIHFVNLFGLTGRWFEESASPLTRDGALLTEEGYARLAPALADGIFGARPENAVDPSVVIDAVREKNWIWHNFYKIPNGVHVYGRRHRPFGPMNYPHELKKLEQMTANRDRAIHAALAGRGFDLAEADRMTHPLPEIETNYRPGNKNGTPEYLYEKDALATFTVADGYELSMFASEREFPNLANPVQLSFDNRGRLWVATMPSYPHYQPGDPRPKDMLLILEDTDGDGKADRETVFADDLHLPTGFELAPEGVYVAQGTHLVLLVDQDGDDRADKREIVLSGFDDHDTHHVISAFCADPSGAIYMGEGTFLHSHIETAYGPVRSSNGGFFRFDPNRRHLERTARLSIPNPWGTAFDEWGQIFFLDTSDPNMRWMTPGTVAVRYGEFSPNPPSLIEDRHRVRPTSGLEFISSRHFPDEVQGDILLHNTIGFLGTKQHTIEDEGTGYASRHRQDLLRSTDGNFRPVDLEFAPDGSLYIVDWHNVLVGHMQHSARDPLRDHVHGRIYRLTYPSRPLVRPARIAGATLDELFQNLKQPEYRTRYRTRRELRGRDPREVMAALRQWTANLNPADEKYEHHLVEALWVSWGLDRIEPSLLRRLLHAQDFRARAAAVRALRYNTHRIPDHAELMALAAKDPHGRVRLETIAAASWLQPDVGLPIVETAGAAGMDAWLKPVYDTAMAHLTGSTIPQKKPDRITTSLTGKDRDLFLLGAGVYRREGHCATCHQEDGRGLPAAQFPPLEESEWVNGDPDRLIKLTLHGLLGPITVKGVDYPGLVPMTAFKGLPDEEIAAVLTYVRNSFGNSAAPVSPEQVARIREATAGKTGFYNPADFSNSR